MSFMIAGFSKVVITPPLGQVAFAGYNGRKHLPRGVLVDETGKRHELYARALVLMPGNVVSPGDAICLVSTDLFMLRYWWVKEVREFASKLTGVPVHNICIHATHSHQGPDSIGIYYPGHNFDSSYLDKDWLSFLKRQIAGAIYGAIKNTFRCRIGFGEASLEGWTINRRDMALFANPPPHPRTIDPQIPVIRVDDLESNPRVIVTGFGTHPTFLNSFEQWCTEHVGFLENEIHAQLGRGIELMYFSGQSGDVIPFQTNEEDRLQFILNPGDRKLQKYQLGLEVQRIGDENAPIIVKNLQLVMARASLSIGDLRRSLRIDLGVPVDSRGDDLVIRGTVGIRDVFSSLIKFVYYTRSIENTKEFAKIFVSTLKKEYDRLTMVEVDENLRVDYREWKVSLDDSDMVDSYSDLMADSSIRDMGDGSFEKPSEVQGIRIGNTYIICIPSEPINEIGLRLKKIIKEHSGLEHVFCFQMCNDGFGYVVTPFEYDAQGYEVTF
ncbi:MAG: neutral/alkaline non-lysosomal ceramidase N-terminal domain-containing protein, partial [Promethearchaeota archaeon]